MILYLFDFINQRWNNWLMICFVLQEVKKAILADLTKLGKSSGLHSFEQASWYTYLLNVPSWSWSYCNWNNNYLHNQCLSLLTLWFRTSFMAGVLDTSLCDKVCQWLTAGQWFSPGTPVSSTNKTDRHDITEVLLKVALSTITLTFYSICCNLLLLLSNTDDLQ